MKIEDIFAGCGIGILTGLLIGLSVSPVVGPVLGAILAFGVLWLSYKEHQDLHHNTENIESIINARKAIAIRLAFFCFSCAAGLLLGVFLRANDSFAPTLVSKRNEWVQLGFSTEQANEILMQQHLRLAANGTSNEKMSTVLYNMSVPIQTLTSKLDPEGYGNIESCLIKYEMLGDKWKGAMDILRKIDSETDQRQALKAIYHVLKGKEG